MASVAVLLVRSPDVTTTGADTLAEPHVNLHLLSSLSAIESYQADGAPAYDGIDLRADDSQVVSRPHPEGDVVEDRGVVIAEESTDRAKVSDLSGLNDLP